MGEATEAPAGEEFTFQAEVSQVLSLVINSLYSNKEIFLRELVSNASDAIDRLKYRALTEHELLGDEAQPEIRVIPDEDAGTLTIDDTGVGMTRQELIDELGTIARSGTRQFLDAVRGQGELDEGQLKLIGQFGVGFYSAYLVADRVEVVSRAAGADEAWCWESDASQGFTIRPAERDERGTAVILHVRDEQREFLRDWTLRELIGRYSDFVSHPIMLKQQKMVPAEEEGGDPTVETEMAQVNRGKALWQRSRSEVEDSEYEEFYKHLAHDWEPPLAHSHFQVEGTQEFTGLLFVPKRAPFDLYTSQRRRGVRLYVKRVFIMDECEEIVPQWLRFLRGVIDSDDLPLNVSREILQDSKAARVIRKQVVKKTLEMLDALATSEDEDERKSYGDFWETFGPVLKEGLHFSSDDRDKIAALARYKSSKSDGGWTSLAEYVERMPEGQEAIYYAVAESEKAAASSPHLEALRSRGWEVLFMTDPIDEWAVRGLGEFQDKKLVSAMQSGLELEEDEDAPDAEEKEQRKDALKGLLERFESVLGEKVKEVVLSKRLTDSPVCLVVPEGGMHAQWERLMRASEPGWSGQKRILEVNPTHPLVEALREHVEADREAERVAAWIEQLYDQALLTEGSPIEDPQRFAARLSELMLVAVRADLSKE